ncbi:hypothetical protein PR202_ga04123 [Eleusine coracana subsp. coracana]|uniref:Pectinesterase inhibitor domain-containing protein n=1 Tax=Eleusine coracana subsp. coracana TaxID=191504 RepID=A0AAV5BQA6_ELECO|nr:hypothetical protein PR202_ga04123 [Eleusine coracana subsp. coracana]
MASSSFYGSASALLLFALLFNTTKEVTADINVDPLLSTCKSIATANTYFDVEFCLSSLGSSNRSHHAKNGVELSSIALDLLAANVTSTLAKIHSLMRGNGGHYKGSNESLVYLYLCRIQYIFIQGEEAYCIAAIKDGKFNIAISHLEKSTSYVKECEDGYSKGNITSPLTTEDNNAFKLVKLAAALLSSPH